MICGPRRLCGPARRPIPRQQEELGGTFGRCEHPGHRLEGHDFLGRAVGIEINGHCFNQRWPIGPCQGVQPRVLIAVPSALQPHPDGAVEPAGESGQIVQQDLGEQKTFALGGNGPEPYAATLVAAMDDGAPTKPWRAMAVPIQDLEQLIFQGIDDER